MLIKNSGSESVRIAMATRVVELGPGEEQLLTAEEVVDPKLREALQLRQIAIVRPATEEEHQALRERLGIDDE